MTQTVCEVNSMQTFISKEKTLKEAIRLGLQSLNLSLNQVQIEVVQPESKGVLGMGAKDAIVKLSYELNEQPNAPNPIVVNVAKDNQVEREDMALDQFLSYIESSDQALDDDRLDTEEIDTNDFYDHASLKGKAWIKDSTLHVKDSEKHTPSIHLTDGVHAKKDGKRIDKRVLFVSEKELITFDLEETFEKTEWSVKVINHDLAVELAIKPGVKHTRQLKDTAPSHQVKIESTEKVELHQTVTAVEIKQRLADLSVQYGIFEEVIHEALNTFEGGTFIIAEGKAATDGKDGWLEKMVATDVLDLSKENDDLAAVDYRERKKLPTVEKGQIIAIIHDPIEGKPGVNVYGKEVAPRLAKQLHVKTQKGTLLLEDRIIANENGRPYIEQRGQYVKTKVLPQMVHNGDVDLGSGNIEFRGDIEIKGEVKEGMKIQSGGHVEIHQTVNGATIHAQKSIRVNGSVNASDVSAGSHVDVEMQHLLESIYQKSERMYIMLKQIFKSKEFKTSSYKDTSVTSLILLLKEKRFGNLPKEIEKFNQLVEQEQAVLIDEEWLKLVEQLKHVFFKIPQVDISLVAFQQMIENMKSLIELSAIQNDQDVELMLKNALNSRLICAGDVTVTGRSCINTYIEADGFVEVKGILRGGHVFAGAGCNINEVGGRLGAKTIVRVPEDQKIRLGKVLEGTVIKIGDMQHIFEQSEMGVYARLNAEGDLQLH